MTKLLLVATLLALFTSCLCALQLPDSARRDVRSTNANRLQRGLPPLKPKRLYEPTRTRPLAPRASNNIVQGYIAVFDTQGNFQGFLQDASVTMDQSDAYVFDTAVAAGPENIAADPSTGLGGWNLEVYPNDQSGYFYSDTEYSLGSIIVGEVNTAPGAVPTNSHESAIFYVGTVGVQVAEINIVWINPNKESVDLGVLYDGTFISVAGDAAAAAADPNNDYTQVILTFYPLP